MSSQQPSAYLLNIRCQTFKEIVTLVCLKKVFNVTPVYGSLFFTATLAQMKKKDKRKMAHWVKITCV